MLTSLVALTIVLVSLQLASFVILGVAFCAMTGTRPARYGTVVASGMLASAALAAVASFIPANAGSRGLIVVALVAAAIVIARRRPSLPPLRDARWPAAIALGAVLLCLYLIVGDYALGGLLDPDAMAFWALRAQRILDHGFLSPQFWSVMHADYPPLVPLQYVLVYLVHGSSGQMPTLAAAYATAIASLFIVLEAMAPLVGRRIALVAIALLFVLAPVPLFPLHPRVLVAGYAEYWSLIYVALVVTWRPGDEKRGISLDEGVLIAIMSLAKNEGLVFSLVWVTLRSACLWPRPAGGWPNHFLRVGTVLAPGLLWLLVAQLSTADSHYGLFALPDDLGTAVSRLGVVVDYYSGLSWAYLMVPVVIALSAWKGTALDRWLAAHALAVLGFMAAAYLMFDGNTRQVIENSFHRLHWPALLMALFAAMRTLGRWPPAASPERAA